MTPPLLELVSVSKTYPGVKALDRVSLRVERGEVLALIGENGAGKSTLMKILGGVVEPSEGVIRIDGAEHGSLTVGGAMAAGIAFVHQELNLFDNLDVAANVMIGREPAFGGPLKLIDRAALRARVTPLLRRLGADFEANTPVARLSLAQRQLVEIAKALSLDARIVIMDEPTSSLTVSETARLLDVIADLKAHGVSVIFISHRLNEVEQCADRVVVLRDGAVVGTLQRGEIRHETMIRMMIGRDLKSLYIPPQRAPGEPVLEAAGVRTPVHPTETIDLALRYLGLGEPQPVAVDDQGRIRVDALAESLKKLDPRSPSIVCLQAGNVHSGAFDPLTEAIQVAHRHGAWVHVDGAFGLWEAASPALRRTRQRSCS